MKYLTETVQKGDWKAEKHVPIIHVPEGLTPGEKIEVSVTIGDEIGHPNTFDHHIAWMKLYFQPEGFKFPIEVGSYQLAAHGEEEVYAEPGIKATLILPRKGTFYAMSYCNIHGLWENVLEV